MSAFKIGRERARILRILRSDVGSSDCDVIRWIDWQARRVHKSRILPDLGINLTLPQYTGTQKVREMNLSGEMDNVTLQFSGYDVPGYENCIIAVTQRGTAEGEEIQAIQLRKYSSQSFPSHLQNLKRE